MTTGILTPMAGVFEGHAVVDNEKQWCDIQNSGEYGFRPVNGGLLHVCRTAKHCTLERHRICLPIFAAKKPWGSFAHRQEALSSQQKSRQTFLAKKAFPCQSETLARPDQREKLVYAIRGQTRLVIHLL
jgi:hypothetical protein